MNIDHIDLSTPDIALSRRLVCSLFITLVAAASDPFAMFPCREMAVNCLIVLVTHLAKHHLELLDGLIQYYKGCPAYPVLQDSRNKLVEGLREAGGTITEEENAKFEEIMKNAFNPKTDSN